MPDDPVTDDERKQVGVMAGVLGALINGMREAKGGPTSPPVTLLAAFLHVCLEEGLSVSEYAARAKMSVSTMNRHLLDLGDRNRKMEPGFGHITSSVDGGGRADVIARSRVHGRLIEREPIERDDFFPGQLVPAALFGSIFARKCLKG